VSVKKMNLVTVSLLLLSLGRESRGGVGQHKDRVLHARPLSDKPRTEGDFLYDHDAFLGEEEAEKFEELSPEESKRRLAVIVRRVDRRGDGDGLVSEGELQEWIKMVQQREVLEDTERQWNDNKHLHPTNDSKISWPSYKMDVYGLKEEDPHHADGYSMEPLLDRDLRRWQHADTDGDMLLTKLEFQAFLHPEELERMRDVIVLEVLEDLDQDEDGVLSEKEYIADMFTVIKGEEEPDWVQEERKRFASERDINGDGFLDAAEVKQWIVPPDFDHSKAEATHLISKADADGDSLLTVEEVLQQYDIFVGSSATAFGDVLTRHTEF